MRRAGSSAPQHPCPWMLVGAHTPCPQRGCRGPVVVTVSVCVACPPHPLAADSFGGDHDAAQAQQTKLLLLSRRLCGTTVGRGMLTLSSLPLSITDALRCPPVTLAAKLSPSGVIVALDVSNVRSPPSRSALLV